MGTKSEAIKVLDSIEEVYVYVACTLIIFIANQSPQFDKISAMYGEKTKLILRNVIKKFKFIGGSKKLYSV